MSRIWDGTHLPEGRSSATPRIFDLEVVRQPCRQGCGHQHDRPQAGPVHDQDGVDMSIPRGATAQNNYSEILAEDAEMLYQCRICEMILHRHELDDHQCLTTIMEDYQ